MKSLRKRTIRIEVSLRTMIHLVLIIAALWLIIRLLPVVLVLVAALMIVGTLGPAVVWLERRSVRRDVGIGIVFTALFVVTTLLFALTIPELINQIRALIGMEPALREQLAVWLAQSPLTAGLAHALRNVHYDELIQVFCRDRAELFHRPAGGRRLRVRGCFSCAVHDG